MNVLKKAVERSWQLNAPPARLLFDYEKRTLFVQLRLVSRLARIDLVGGEQTYINLNGRPKDVALGPAGKLFMSREREVWNTEIDLVDERTGFEKTVASDPLGGSVFLGFDRRDGLLIASGNEKYNPGKPFANTYSFDAKTGTLTHLKKYPMFGEPNLSLDSKHVIFGSAGSSIIDYSPRDLGSPLGEWKDTGLSGIAFSPDSRKLVSSYITSLPQGPNFRVKTRVFGVDSHSLVEESEVEEGNCTYPWGFAGAFSEGGRIRYRYVRCGTFNHSEWTAWLTWWEAGHPQPPLSPSGSPSPTQGQR
jgi:hypothetical protein